MKFKGIAIAVAAALISPAFGQSKITIKGSDTLGAKMVPLLTDVYKAVTKSSVDFDIAAEGSSQAFSALLDGTADIGMSSRSVKSTEVDKFTAKGQKLEEHVAGVDMIAVIVNKANGVKALTKAQVEGIFTGTITDWAEVGGKPGKISAYTRNTTSGTYKTFMKLGMSGKDYGKNTEKKAGNLQIAEAVAATTNGIGYVGLAYVKTVGIKPTAVDGVLPEPANQKTYPLSRNLYYYTIGAPKGESKKFLTWAMTSDDAAKVITQVGFIAPAK